MIEAYRESHDDGHADDVLRVVSNRSDVMQDVGAVVQNAHAGSVVVDRVRQIVQRLLPEREKKQINKTLSPYESKQTGESKGNKKKKEKKNMNIYQ